MISIPTPRTSLATSGARRLHCASCGVVSLLIAANSGDVPDSVLTFSSTPPPAGRSDDDAEAFPVLNNPQRSICSSIYRQAHCDECSGCMELRTEAVKIDSTARCRRVSIALRQRQNFSGPVLVLIALVFIHPAVAATYRYYIGRNCAVVCVPPFII